MQGLTDPTGFCESIGDLPNWASAIAIPSANARATSRALLSRWRDSSRFYQAYDEISGWVGEALHITQKICEISLENLANVATFEAVERQIIVDLTKAIPEADPRDLGLFAKIISERLDNYWATRHKDDETRRKYRLLYTALSSAIDLFTQRHQHAAGFHFASTEAVDTLKMFAPSPPVPTISTTPSSVLKIGRAHV